MTMNSAVAVASTLGGSSTSVPPTSPTALGAASDSGASGGASSNMKVILASPVTVRNELPATEAVRRLVHESRAAITRILAGRSHRLLAIVGPCSIHDPIAALDYGRKLAELAAQHADELLIVMRVYCEKPRTGAGWKGLIRDPFLDGSNDIGTGLLKARQLLLQLNALGLPCACEFLDPLIPEYIGDLVSWGAIGARTAESQIHRELASGLSMPVGFKNSTSGSLSAAIDGMLVASRPHSYISINSEGHVAALWTKGNPSCHVVLRGGHDRPNYEAADIEAALKTIWSRVGGSGHHHHHHHHHHHQLDEGSSHSASTASQQSTIAHVTSVIVDCSHGNSNKDYRRQRDVVHNIATQLTTASHARSIAGIMLESFLVQGAQQLKDKYDLEYGKSVTDGCINLAETAELLSLLAEAVRARRKTKREDSPAAQPSPAGGMLHVV